MANTALNRTEAVLLTNKSGGSVAKGDVVVIDATTAASFTTTTTEGYSAGMVGVVLEPNGIASNAAGMVALGGYVPKVNLDASATLGYFVKTDSVAKQGTPVSARAAGSFGVVLGTGTGPAATLWGITDTAGVAGPYTQGARVTNSGAQTITHNTTTALTFDTETYDTDTMHSTVSNTNRLTATTAGTYILTASCSFAAHATGIRLILIVFNNTTTIAESRIIPGAANQVNLCVTAIMVFTATQYAEARVTQTSGGDLAASNQSFAMQRIG